MKHSVDGVPFKMAEDRIRGVLEVLRSETSRMHFLPFCQEWVDQLGVELVSGSKITMEDLARGQGVHGFVTSLCHLQGQLETALYRIEEGRQQKISDKRQ